MNISQRDRDHGTGLCDAVCVQPNRTHRRRPRHANGGIAATLLASDRPRLRRQRCSPKSPRARRGPHPVPRQAWPRRPAARALLPSWHHTVLRQGRGDGIRCCYHGWKFDVEGHCLEQPCEVDGGQFRDKVRQPWYPVQERYGLVFAFMGPSERKPVLPRYEALENMDEGEFVEADDSSIGGGGPAVIPCNWLQHFENVVDPYHVPVLHGRSAGRSSPT